MKEPAMPSVNAEIRVVANAEELSQAAAAEFV